MGRIFKDDLYDEFAWAVGYIPYGAADIGEIEAVAATVGEGGDTAFYDAWMASGARLEAQAEEALAKGHRSSASDLYLRASAFYASSYHPLYGTPVDPRLVGAFRKQIAAFDKGLALQEPAIQPLRIPFEGVTLPAYFIPSASHAGETRPLVIFTNGYDATVTEMYFASAVAASRRGYHSLIFDGPGQGEMLIEHGLHLRPDWETVVNRVVDFALEQPGVDRARIALSGWSLGGYLAPRAASGEPRLAACIADPGLPGIAGALRSMAITLGAPPDAVGDLGNLDPKVRDGMWNAVSLDRKLRWSIAQRGFWVNGANDFAEWLRCIEAFTLDGRTERITCPTLLTCAENDSLAAGAPALFEALRCPKTLLRFTSAEGAGMHVEGRNRSLLNRRVFDWLDELFAR
jgi:alpha-beta hydrolase superfamily lysophospholipase